MIQLQVRTLSFLYMVSECNLAVDNDLLYVIEQNSYTDSSGVSSTTSYSENFRSENLPLSGQCTLQLGIQRSEPGIHM